MLPASVSVPPPLLLLVLPLLLLTWLASATVPPYTECGGHLTGPKGFIHTPGFPGPFPVPIRCRWVIEAPSDKTIAVYFTQFYLREGVRATEYNYYAAEWSRKDWVPISFDNRTTYLITVNSALELELAVDEATNINMRVVDYFLDVHGFNLTYEIIDRGEGRRRSACSVFHCSFNGHCLASASFHRYRCHCFDGFFGDQCQFGPHCDPERHISLCKADKSCRYAIGSQVYQCECPADHEGDRCENRACKKMNCSQLCVPKSPKGFQCACSSGYKLRPDNKTCMPYERVRYLISFKLNALSFDPGTANKNSTMYKELKTNITNELYNLLSKKLHQVKNLTILNFSPGAVVEFHFFGLYNDSDRVHPLIGDALSTGKIGKIPVLDYITFEKELALSLQRVDVQGGRSLIAGKAATLDCVAIGTKTRQFTWFKDGVPVDVTRSNRHMWQTILPKNLRNEYTALLGIEKVEPLDKGVFTCQVSDFGEVQNKSVSIQVISPPTVNVTPAMVTLALHSEITIMCLSHEDFDGSFSYTWDKNGRLLNPSDGQEVVEDLFPTGSRVKILQATQSAQYTCIVSNKSGQSNKTSYVNIILSDLVRTCSEDISYNVMWQRTKANDQDLQPCPNSFSALVRRRCILVNDIAVWEEPDFSECMSADLSNVYRNFEYLKLGYMATTVTSTLQEVKSILQKTAYTMYPGEGKRVLDLLLDMRSYEEKYSVKNKRHAFQQLLILFDIISLLLGSPKAINTPQKSVLLFDQMKHQVISLASHLIINSSQSVVHEAFFVEAANVAYKEKIAAKFPSNSSSSPKWLMDNVSVSFDPKIGLQSATPKDNSSIAIEVVFYRNLSSFLPKLYPAKYDGMQVEYIVGSHIVMVLGQNKFQNVPLYAGSINIHITFDQRKGHINYSDWNITCGRADFEDKPQWILSACSIKKTQNLTHCHCDQFGTYAILLSNYIVQGDDELNWNFHPVVALCCCLGIIFLFLTVLFLVIFCRKIQKGIVVLKLQLCIGLMGALCGFLTAARTSLHKDSFPLIATMLEFFILLPFSTQVCLELTVYLELAHTYHMQNAHTKIILVGWGIPVLVTGACIAAQSQTGFKFESWWIQIGDIYFYGFVITAIILTFLYITIYLIVSAEFRHKKSVESTKGKLAEKSFKLLQRSLVVQVFLIAMTMSSIIYVNINEPSMRYIFSASNAAVGFIVFVMYGLSNEILCSCKKKKDEKYDTTTMDHAHVNESVQAFIKREAEDDYAVANHNTASVDRLRREKLRKILQGNSDQQRETEDLLPDVTAFSSPAGYKGSLTATVSVEPRNEDEPLNSFPGHKGAEYEPKRFQTNVLGKGEQQQKVIRSSNGNVHRQDSSNVNIIKEEVDEEQVSAQARMVSSPFEEEEDDSEHAMQQPQPGICYILQDEEDDEYRAVESKASMLEPVSRLSRHHEKRDSSPHVTFGPVLSVPLEEEEDLYSQLAAEDDDDDDEPLPPPPPRFQNQPQSVTSMTSSLLKNRLPYPLKLDGIVYPFASDRSEVIASDRTDRSGDEPSVLSGSTSSDSHDTAV